MLSKQNVVSQTIYTTHSVGCLPEDLGNGIRLIRVRGDDNESEVINKLWAENIPGLSPLILGMGARTMAFLPTRNCVFTEGPVDFLLYPTIFRDATNNVSLGVQFLPSLSIADGEAIKAIQSEGKRLIYLVDGDTGGNALRAKLRKAGVANDSIFDLGQLQKGVVVVEDLVEDQPFVDAVNAELKQFNIGEAVRLDELPASNRSQFLKDWCAKNAGGAI